MTWLNVYKWLLFTVTILLFNCNASKKLRTEESSGYSFPYDLLVNQEWVLDSTLNEVSGLSYDLNTENLLAVEDEHGLIYFLDKASGKKISTQAFHKDGDYEGVTNSTEHIFILKSNGNIYQIDKTNLDSKPEKLESFLNKDYDAEGIVYHRNENALLICVKENPEDKDQNRKKIYIYDLDESEMQKEPFLLIERSEITALINDKYSKDYAQENFKKILDPKKANLHLCPSGLAIHPQTKNLYIVSSKSKVLLIYDLTTKKLLDIYKLDKKTLPQPEGICFDKIGNLYISSEGREEQAKLLKLSIRN